MREPRSLLRTVGSISSATFVSRILGLIRDQAQSYFFGAGLITDAYLAAFRVPNLLRDLFAEGALSSAFVPTFTSERRHHGAEAAWRLANRVITALILLLGALALVIVLFAPGILRVYVAGFEAEKMDLAVTMTRIVAPFLLFVALAAVAMGMLNACGRFFLPALAPASFNVAAIVSMLALVPVLPRIGLNAALALPIGAIVGGALQFLVQVPAMRREGFRFRPELALRDPALRRIGRLMLPATFGLAATQINILVDTVLASSYEGAITWLQLAFRLMQLPLGLFGVAIGSAHLARVSRDAASGDLGGMRKNLATALRAGAILSLPATAGLIALREPIVRLLFEHGRFDAHDTANTSAAVACYAIGLVGYTLTKTQVPTYYALGETRTPVKASATAVGFKIAASFVLIALLPRMGLPAFLGLALSTSLAAWLNCAFLARGLRRRVGGLASFGVLSTCFKMAGLSALMGLAVSWAYSALELWLPGPGLVGEVGRLGVAILFGMAFLTAGIRVLDLPEGRLVFDRLRLGRRTGKGRGPKR